MSKNLCGKTRGVNNPYEVWVLGQWEWRVLKKYQRPDKEKENPQARWFCAVSSPMTGNGYEMGDTYVREIIESGAMKLVDISGLEKWRVYT